MEFYELNWIGKKKAIELAYQPTSIKLVEDREHNSLPLNDSSKNIFIEGDNLEVLKILQSTHKSSIKMIYIDPPYNTGKKFLYSDNFSYTSDELSEFLDIPIDDAEKIIKKYGRFKISQSAWLNMMLPRLYLAKNLLRDDGVIFISIDDNEQAQLKLLCDDIFHNDNFVGCICRATGTTTGQNANKIGSSLDYCLVYSKSHQFKLGGIPLTGKDLKRFKEKDDKGSYSLLQLRKTGNEDKKEDRPNMFYPIIAPDGTEVYPFGPSNYLSRWRVSKESFDNLVAENMITWKNNIQDEDVIIEGYKKSNWVPYVKYYAEGRMKQVSNLFLDIEGNKKASIDLKNILGGNKFSYPKPLEFIKILLQIGSDKNATILDFFAGSGTTAHAVMSLNSDDGGNRQFITVQLPEEIPKTSGKSGYRYISEITKDRIRHAGKQLLQNNPENRPLDVGFKVFKTQ